MIVFDSILAILLSIATYLAILRFLLIRKIHSELLFFRLMYHHCIPDFLFCLGMIPLFIAALFAQGNPLADSSSNQSLVNNLFYGLVLFSSSFSTVFAFHFSCSGYLRLLGNNFYFKYYKLILAYSYFGSMAGAVTRTVLRQFFDDNLFLFMIGFVFPIIVCFGVLGINLKIILYAREHSLIVDKKNLIFFPLMQAAYWLILLVLLYLDQLKSTGPDFTAFTTNFLVISLTIYPIAHYLFYNRQVELEYTRQQNKLLEDDKEISEAARAVENMKTGEYDYLQRVQDL